MSQELPSGGGAYERKADGSLSQVEAPTAPESSATAPAEASVEGLAAGLEAPVKGAIQAPAKSKMKEA